MNNIRRVAVALPLAGMLMAGSAAYAADQDAGPGGLLSNLEGRNASGHANDCGTADTVLSDYTCVARHKDASRTHKGDQTGASGGILSNVLSRNASGHSNVCGTGLVTVLSRITCVTEHYEAR
ncbi:hypothetical protein ABZ383_21115 [Streptomyces sp. NPDC005900]|uniref:hypothetical protein n=1 Tax=Streptomyces sp. NPDC005900 TaxID=3154569 RepID=UPI003410396D